jgi:uncharacterized tellurite resistance protein B-like protein
MPSRPLIVNLGHALIAAAWADGELSQEELQSLKDLLFQLPGLRPEHWTELERRADIPVGPEERERITESLSRSIASDEDRQWVLHAMDTLLRSDGAFGESERRALLAMQESIRGENRSLWDGLKQVFANPLRRRVEAAASAYRPQSRGTDLHQAVFREVGERLDELGAPPELDGEALRRLCLAGGLMAHVARVDEVIDAGEKEVMVQALIDGWNLHPTTAKAVVEVMLVHSDQNLDLHRALREFFELTSESERIAFLDVLFSVAAADGMVSSEEIEEIRLITLGLKLSQVHFIAAKTRVPAAHRER